MAEENDDKPKAPRRTRTPQNSVQEQSVTESADVTKETEVVTATPVAAPVPSVSYADSQVSRVVLGGETDPVYLSKIIPFNKHARKSLSVRHLQFRLSELGYDEALVDNEGYYGAHVQAAVAAFQKDHDLVETGEPDAGTIAAVFDGDPNVDLHLA